MNLITIMLATVVAAANPEKGLVFVGAETPQFAVSAVPADGAAWTVSDWRGATRAEGRLAADGALEVAGLSPGYWTLAVDGAAPLGFTTVIDPATRRKVEQSPYAADSAFSWMDIAWCYRKDFKTDFAEHLARLIQASGLTQTRERFCWGDVQKEKGGPINWGKYLRNERLLASKGIKTSWYNHNSPKFVGGKGGGWGGSQSCARDLVAVRDFCERVGRDFGSTLADFEYFNEPDLGLPAWDVTAQYKAASVGFRAAKSGVPTTNFSMCLGVDFNYDNLVFDNDMAKYIDIFNIHHYGNLSSYDSFNARIHAFLEKRGIGDYPILITESGCDYEGEATLPTDVDRCKAHTPAQEMIVADFIPKAQIKRQFGGVWRNHFFIFASFHERGGRKDWGIIRRDGTARPGLAAFAALTAELDGFRILGRAEVGAGVEAYLYDRGDGTKTLAYWGKGQDVFVRCASPARLVDWCGTPREVRPADGVLALAADEHVSYLTGELDVTVAQAATPTGTLRLHEPPEGEDLETIIRVDFPKEEFDVVDGMTAVETKKDGVGRVTIEIWNLSDRPKRGKLYSKNGTIDGWPEGEIELPARGVFAREVTLRPLVGRDGEAKWMLRGVFDGLKTTRFAVPVRDFASGLKTLRRVTVAANDPAVWLKNNSALKTTFRPEGEAMRIDMSWVTTDPSVKTSDRWAYNQIRVPEAAQKGLKYVVFEIKSEQDKVENNFQCANVYTYGKNRGDRIVCNKPMKEWTKVHVSVPAKENAPVELVGVGANPIGRELTFWVRNVAFYCTGE